MYLPYRNCTELLSRLYYPFAYQAIALNVAQPHDHVQEKPSFPTRNSMLGVHRYAAILCTLVWHLLLGKPPGESGHEASLNTIPQYEYGYVKPCWALATWRPSGGRKSAWDTSPSPGCEFWLASEILIRTKTCRSCAVDTSFEQVEFEVFLSCFWALSNL